MVLALSFSLFSADPFYENLLKEGKQLFSAGKYDEALESFKIAEFGLLDERDKLPELIFYYALANYKKGRVQESQQLLEKLKTATGTADYASLSKPKEIEGDLSIMIRALNLMKNSGSGFSLEFFNLFYETIDLIRQNKVNEASQNLKKLEKSGDKSGRIAFLEGSLAFSKQDFKKCIAKLGKIVDLLDMELQEDAAFYLAYSFLQRGDASNGSKYWARVKNPEYIHRLMVLNDELKAAQDEKSQKKEKSEKKSPTP